MTGEEERARVLRSAIPTPLGGWVGWEGGEERGEGGRGEKGREGESGGEGGGGRGGGGVNSLSHFFLLFFPQSDVRLCFVLHT